MNITRTIETTYFTNRCDKCALVIFFLIFVTFSYTTIIVSYLAELLFMSNKCTVFRYSVQLKDYRRLICFKRGAHYYCRVDDLHLILVYSFISKLFKCKISLMFYFHLNSLLKCFFYFIINFDVVF